MMVTQNNQMQRVETDLASIRETTPLVTDMDSPPIGYPTTVTASCIEI
jgi:hypothetical protein